MTPAQQTDPKNTSMGGNFPKSLDNKAGASRIDYRIGTYNSIREAMLRELDKSRALWEWTYRGSDDPGIALIEGASILCDILTFYQNLYANQAFLRTAEWRENISKLVRLTGYFLAPGAAGHASFAFEVGREKKVVIPAGFPLKAQLEGMEANVDFETDNELIAYPALNKMTLYNTLETPTSNNQTATSLPLSPSFATKEFYIYGQHKSIEELNAADPSSYDLEQGDRLLIFAKPLPSELLNSLTAEIIFVNSVHKLHGRTLFTANISLEENQLLAYKLGRSFRHFGHDAPQIAIEPINGNGETTEPTYVSINYDRELGTGCSTTESTFKIEPSPLYATDFPLDVEVDDLPRGNELVFQYGQDFFIREIREIRKFSCTWGALTGSSSIVSIGINKELYGGGTFDIRNLVFHEILSPCLELRPGVQYNKNEGGKKFLFFDEIEPLEILNDRRIIFFHPSKSLFATVETVDEDPTDDFFKGLDCRAKVIILKEPINRDDIDEPRENSFDLAKPISYENIEYAVYGNLVDATQGKTEKESVLGSGDNRQKFQTFKLPKSPLTYVFSKDETPPEVPELTIYVNNQRWTRVSSFFNRKSTEEIYVVREDDNGDSWVQFGDGKTGARLPSGIDNVVARYRTGIGANGVLKEGTTVQAGRALPNLQKTHLVSAVSGGSLPETGGHAQDVAPGKFQSLGRLVSLQDYESEALALSGVVKAKATWEINVNSLTASRSISSIIITVLLEAESGNGFDEIEEKMKKLDKYNGPQRHFIEIREGRFRDVKIEAAYTLDPNFRGRPAFVENKIKAALGLYSSKEREESASNGLFSLSKRTFGQMEYWTRIEGTIQSVNGVLWTKINQLSHSGTEDQDWTIIDGSSEQKNFPCAPDEILRLSQVQLHRE